MSTRDDVAPRAHVEVDPKWFEPFDAHFDKPESVQCVLAFGKSGRTILFTPHSTVKKSQRRLSASQLLDLMEGLMQQLRAITDGNPDGTDNENAVRSMKSAITDGNPDGTDG